MRKALLLAGACLMILMNGALAQVPQSQHVFVVVEEGNGYESVINSASMPYLNQLASQYGLATQYYANTGSSIGNNFVMTTGEVITTNEKLEGTVSHDNIIRHLLQSGKTWKSYAESLPYAGYTGPDKYPYLRSSNPFAFFTDVANSSEKLNLVPFTQLQADLANVALPNLSFIIPNATNNMRDCPSGMTTCTYAQKQQNADNWLKRNIAPLLASKTFQEGGVLFIVFNRGAAGDTRNGGGKTAALVISPSAKKGYKSTALYHHKNLLKTVMRTLGVNTFPAIVSTTATMQDFFEAETSTTSRTATSSTTTSTGFTTALTTSTGSVSVTTPANGATVSSPVRVVASATSSYPITAMRIYVDGVSKYSVNAARIDTSVSLANGYHTLTVQAWNSQGEVFKNTRTINVSGSTSSTSSGYHLYVSTSGNDLNPGTSTRPFRTIQRGVNAAVPGTTVHVAPGIYQERVNITKSGTSTARIVLKSDTKWGAKVPTTSSQGYYHIGVNANYVDVVGFDVYGANTSTAGIGIDVFGSYNRVIGNRVRDLITSDCSGRGGLVGITVPWTGQTVAKRKYNEITGNVVYNVRCTTFPGPKAGACIYIADQHNTVNNNLVYTCGSYGIESNHLTGWNKIINNTVANVPNGYGSAGIMMSAGGDSTYKVLSDYNIVANNIVIDSNQGIVAYYGMNGTLGTHNVWSNNLTWNNKVNKYCKSGGYCPPDTNGLHVNPMFVYKSYSGSGNFKLQSSSPALNKATRTYAPTFDIEGVGRPKGVGPDIGSYESY
ncbi:MAG TPA: alkaline phosphatase family protein [Terriglobales bacterium]|nr:alkaline phosphatase family protein [Terriglobales bacterium]